MSQISANPMKYQKINVEETIPITDKQPLILKNTFLAI